MKPKWFSIEARADSTADIYIYDVIGESFWGESVTAKQFIEDLNALDVKTINLRINSPGGSVTDGVAIYNALLRKGAHINAYNDGAALSIASLIMMAGDTRTMAENALFMIHDPWAMVSGNAAELRKAADIMDRAKEGMLNTYTSRTGMDREEISALMSAESWYTAQEAKDAGFVDAIDSPIKMAAKFDLNQYGFKNTPQEQLVASWRAAYARRDLEIIEL